jgi:hypothetical protein
VTSANHLSQYIILFRYSKVQNISNSIPIFQFNVNLFSRLEITAPEDIFTELVPNDTGLESPNPSNTFMFNKVDANGIEEFLQETGKPYRWAQRLAGLEFPEIPKIARVITTNRLWNSYVNC